MLNLEDHYYIIYVQVFSHYHLFLLSEIKPSVLDLQLESFPVSSHFPPVSYKTSSRMTLLFLLVYGISHVLNKIRSST